MYLLDTDTVSFALRGQGNAAARIRQHKPSDLAISSITLAELRFGADRKGSRKLHALLDTFTSTISALPFDDQAAREFGRVGSLLAARGTPIGDFDTLAAAHAIALGRTFVTNNIRHFSRVTGLTTENWA